MYKTKSGIEQLNWKKSKVSKSPAALLWAWHGGNRCVQPWNHPLCSPPYPMPTALSTPFASISLHKAHKLPKSETHGNVTREKLHFTLHLHDQHHAQMKFQLLPPSPDDRSVREHRGLEGRSQVPQEPLGLGAGGCTNTHQQMLQVSLREPGGELNMMQIVWSNSFALICTIIILLHNCFTSSIVQRRKETPKCCLETTGQVLARSY